jgi:hypothetical protein
VGDQFTIPAENRIWREQVRGLFEEPSRQTSDLCCQPDPLVVFKQSAFVLFLLLLQEADLFLDLVDGFPEFLVYAVRQIGKECDL